MTQVNPYRVLLFLLVVDLLFIGLHFLHVRESLRFSLLANSFFRIDVDHGFAEMFQYLKLAVIVYLLGLLFFRRHYSAAGAWAAVFGAVLLDDALMLHERVGALMASGVVVPAITGLGRSEVGELLTWVVAGVALGMLLLVAYLRTPEDSRGFSRVLFALLAAFAFFGVVADMLHNLVTRKYLADALLPHGHAIVAPVLPTIMNLLQFSEAPFPITVLSIVMVLPALSLSLVMVADALQGALRLDLLFTLIEDGGEMLVISMTTAYCLLVFQGSTRVARRQVQSHQEVGPPAGHVHKSK